MWHRLLSLKSFWIRKCEYNGYLSDHQNVLKQLTLDLKKVCVLRTFENNLIDDSGASGTSVGTRRGNNDYAQPRGYDRRWHMTEG